MRTMIKRYAIGTVVAVLALGAGLYFYFRRRSASRYTEDDTAWRK